MATMSDIKDNNEKPEKLEGKALVYSSAFTRKTLTIPKLRSSPLTWYDCSE